MFEMFQYEFMTRAFIVASILAIILPCIGLAIVLKRLSMMGDTLSHASLAGVALGLALGFNPVFGAILACVLAGLSVEVIRNKLKDYREISTVIILAAAIGIAGIFSSFGIGGNQISAYLFGSIVTISNLEFYLIILVSAFVLIVYIIIYKQLYLTIFDQKAAEIMQINTKLINLIFTILTSITVSLAAKTIGSLIVSSLLVIPVISAMQISKTYKSTLFISMIFSIIFTYLGLVISYFYNLKPGSVIVLLSVLGLGLLMLLKK